VSRKGAKAQRKKIIGANNIILCLLCGKKCHAKAQRKKIIGANNIILCVLCICGKKRHAKAQRRKEKKLSVPIISSFVCFVEKSVTQRRKGAKKKNYRCQ